MKKYANAHGWSETMAYEVVRVVSERTLEVRRLKATLVNGVASGEPDALQFSPGGFCGHTSGVQRYTFASDTEALVLRIRLGKRGWRSVDGTHFSLADEPCEFYDFNF